MRATASIILASAIATLTVPAAAQFSKPEDAIKYRQNALFVMSQHFGRLGAMANGRLPFDPQAAAVNAETVAHMARLPWPAFAPGTDQGAPTKAKPEIWLEPAKFKEGNEKLVVETAKLAAAAKTGNLDSLKTAFAATANACKSCHDAYRSK